MIQPNSLTPADWLRAVGISFKGDERVSALAQVLVDTHHPALGLCPLRAEELARRSGMTTRTFSRVIGQLSNCGAVSRMSVRTMPISALRTAMRMHPEGKLTRLIMTWAAEVLQRESRNAALAGAASSGSADLDPRVDHVHRRPGQSTWPADPLNSHGESRKAA